LEQFVKLIIGKLVIKLIIGKLIIKLIVPEFFELKFIDKQFFELIIDQF
jgi:hypothetical protein